MIWRRDRYLRGGDHFPFLDEGYPARALHRARRGLAPPAPGRARRGRRAVRRPARVRRLRLRGGRGARECRGARRAGARRPRRRATSRWRTCASRPTRRCAGRRIPSPTSPAIASCGARPPRADWQHSKDVGNVTRDTLAGVSKDNFSFGVQAYDRDGNVSVAAYPKPYRPLPPPPLPCSFSPAATAREVIRGRVRAPAKSAARSTRAAG